MFNLWILTLLLFPFVCLAEPLKMEIGGEAAILINAETGALLFEKSAHVPSYPASTTKIATALYVLKKMPHALNTLVTVGQEAIITISMEEKQKSHFTLPAYWLEPGGSHIGLQKGEEMALLDLLKGMLIPSANDASNVIAEFVGGTIPNFINQLNSYLKEIGCHQTHFYNPHGLHHPSHQTTAYDLALMTKEALKDPLFCEIVSQPRYTRPKTNKQKAVTLLQTNRLLRQGQFYYPKAIGVKTGYHSKAKSTFVGAARVEGRTLIAVLLGYQERDRIFQDAIKLFETAFNQPKVRATLLKKGEQKKCTRSFSYGNNDLHTYLMEDVYLDYYPAEDPHPRPILYWDPLLLPIEANQKVGEIHLIAKDDGRLLKKATLFALEPVNIRWPYNWLVSIKEFSFRHSLLAAFLVVALCSLILAALYQLCSNKSIS